jgi:hypothetical protein
MSAVLLRSTSLPPIACHERGSRHLCKAAGAPQAVPLGLRQQQQQQQYPLPSLQQYDDFELLWLEYRHDLSISKTAAVWALQDVQLGLLPCDADLLRDRAQHFAALSQQGISSRSGSSSIDTRRILNSSRYVLAYDSM